MKKYLYLLMSLFLVFLTACSNPNVDKLSEIKEKGKITLAVSPDYPPYEFYTAENGQVKVVGADIFLAEEIAKELGVKLEIVQLSFDSLLPALNSGRVDMVISGMNPNEERRQVVDFSDTYYVSGSAFIVKNKDITSEEDLKKMRIGVQKGSIQEKFLLDEMKLPMDNLQALADTPSLLQDLSNENIDAIFMAEDVSKISLAKEKDLKLSTFKFAKDAESDGMAIAFEKSNNADLITEVNKVVNKLKSENKFEQELNKYAALVAESEE
ncbi:MAG: transporter substrate-binding domain-containing protein [Gemella sp.]|nr:transporter substrate-binding domain-containing protein [Gemella sp.]